MSVKISVSEFKGSKSVDITFGEDKHFTFMAGKAAALLTLIESDLPGLTHALREVAGVSAAPPVAELPLPPIGNPPVKTQAPIPVTPPAPPAPPVVQAPAPPAPPAPPSPPVTRPQSGVKVRFKGKDRTPTATGTRHGKRYVQMSVQGRSPGQWYALTTDTRHPGVTFARECRVPMSEILPDTHTPAPAPVATPAPVPTVKAPAPAPAPTPAPSAPVGTIPAHFAPLPTESGMLANGYVTIGGLRLWIEVDADGLVSGMVAPLANVA